MLRWLTLIFVSLISAASATAQEAVKYRVTVNFDWSGDNLPAGAHWSRLIAVPHQKQYNLFKDGDTASSGVALVATNGRVNVLEAELSEARRRGRVGEPVVLGGVNESVAQFEFELTLTPQMSQISFASMLAPSPDWFSGLGGVALQQDGNWLENMSVPLWVWDAGVDSGPTFTSPNADTQPRQSVRLLTHPAFLTAAGLLPIGTATFTRLP